MPANLPSSRAWPVPTTSRVSKTLSLTLLSTTTSCGRARHASPLQLTTKLLGLVPQPAALSPISRLSRQRSKRRGRFAMMCCRFVGRSNLQQQWLIERSADEIDTDWQHRFDRSD
jgi:hypothetical protein